MFYFNPLKCFLSNLNAGCLSLQAVEAIVKYLYQRFSKSWFWSVSGRNEKSVQSQQTCYSALHWNVLVWCLRNGLVSLGTLTERERVDRVSEGECEPVSKQVFHWAVTVGDLWVIQNSEKVKQFSNPGSLKFECLGPNKHWVVWLCFVQPVIKNYSLISLFSSIKLCTWFCCPAARTLYLPWLAPWQPKQIASIGVFIKK